MIKDISPHLVTIPAIKPTVLKEGYGIRYLIVGEMCVFIRSRNENEAEVGDNNAANVQGEIFVAMTVLDDEP